MRLLASALVGLALIQMAWGFSTEYFDQYEGHSVYKVFPTDESHLELLQSMAAKFSSKISMWTELRHVVEGSWIDIMVHESMRPQFEELMTKINVKFTVNIPNVADAIRSQIDINNQQSTNVKLGDFDYGKYHTLDEINSWILSIETAYPKYVTIFNVTRSYQKRDISAIKISIPNASNKPAFWFDGGIHAREWISPATVIYIAYSLLSKYNNDSVVTELLNTYDFYILPVFNVDGYEYTWSNDRLWRKTRSKTRVPGCVGADPNRNWDAHFCENGASKDPCSDTYCGEKAFSEVEVRGVANFLAKNNDTIKCYINFHSYSQLWMTPWGYTTDKPPKFSVQDNGSVAAITALSKLYGTQFQHGNIASTIYVASGGSVDWTYDAINIVYSYAVELRDQGQYGFLLPPDQIIPSGEETFEAIKALALYIKNQGKF